MTYWQTERLTLRRLQPDDAEFFWALNQDHEADGFLDHVQLPDTLVNVQKWAEKTATEKFEDDRYFFVMVARDLPGDVRVGAIDTHTLYRRAGTFKYGLVVHQDYRRRGYASDAIRLVLRYYFDELAYRTCHVDVHENNPASAALHEHLGFILEGRIRRTVYTGGQYLDEWIYGITAEEFRAAHGQQFR